VAFGWAARWLTSRWLRQAIFVAGVHALVYLAKNVTILTVSDSLSDEAVSRVARELILACIIHEAP